MNDLRRQFFQFVEQQKQDFEYVKKESLAMYRGLRNMYAASPFKKEIEQASIVLGTVASVIILQRTYARCVRNTNNVQNDNCEHL